MTSLAQIQTVLNATETVGAKVPAELTKAISRAAKVREAAAAMTSGRNDIAAAVLAAIDANRDPAADPEVQRLNTIQALHDGVRSQVTNLADAEVVTALQGNVDALIESWREPFDKAAADIASAAASLGNIDLAAASDVLHRGGDAAEQWGIATRADRTIREVLDAFALLAHLTGFASLTRHYLVLRMATVTLDQWEGHGLVERKLTAWEAQHLGLTLSLANRQTLPQRIARLGAEREARATSAVNHELGKGSIDWVKKYQQ
jgi:hypothetical protein